MALEPVPLAKPLPQPEDAHPAPIGFNKIRWAVPTGSNIVAQSVRGLTGVLTCEGPFTTVQAGINGRDFPNDQYQTLFRDEMESMGYDITGDPGIMFDEVADAMRSSYSIGARITDLKINACKRKSMIFGYDKGYDGEAVITIEWTLYDLLHRKTVLKQTHKGYARQQMANFDGLDLLSENAFKASAHNLGADPVFHDLIFNGIAPPKKESGLKKKNEAPRKFDPQEVVTLPAQKLHSAADKLSLKEAERNAVLIEAGKGFGSGFFITPQGHILTNAHVVGHAERMRIVTHGKKDKIVAEVLRTDPLRDVALLRVEEMPENLHIKPLPLDTNIPTISADVYAIGAPLYKRLQDTVTKGIVSAYRYDKKERQHYIQADVDIHPGSSGGPLVDAYGNIIGLSVAGYGDENNPNASLGLNLFIPIGDALEKLDIQIRGNDELSGGTNNADGQPTKLQ